MGEYRRRSIPSARSVHGKVVSITDYGAFVELEKGIEGLIHISEMSWTQHIKHPSKIMHVGDKVEAMVLNVDKENQKISLGHQAAGTRSLVDGRQQAIRSAHVMREGPQSDRLRRLRRTRGRHRRSGAYLRHVVDTPCPAPVGNHEEG